MDTGKQSLAQNVKLKCRVCTKEVYRKNYKTHLQSSHPSQNCEDLSPLGQSKITSLFEPVPPPKPTDVVDEEIELSLLEGQSKKRRHESGESVESGFTDTYEDTTSGKKKTKNDDACGVTLEWHLKQKNCNFSLLNYV